MNMHNQKIAQKLFLKGNRKYLKYFILNLTSMFDQALIVENALI